MSKMLACAAVLSLCLLSGCTAVVVRKPACHVQVTPQCPQQEYPQEKPPVGPDTGVSVYFFRLFW